MDNKWNPKRILALMIVIFLVMNYVVTLIVAIAFPGSGSKLLGICFMATVCVPVMAYFGIWLYTQATGKKTIASVPEIPGEKEAREAKEAQESEAGEPSDADEVSGSDETAEDPE